jgi:hypothetical protein
MKLASGDAPDNGGLESIDSGIYKGLTVFGSATGYCLSATLGTQTAKVVGPGGTVNDAAGTTACVGATG